MLSMSGLARAAPGSLATRVFLYTMGPGEEPFSLFGHAALCVFGPTQPKGRCYNYGTTDFSRPGRLTLDFLRGKARFWVSAAPEQDMVRAYRRSNRSVFRQELPLSAEQATRLAGTLERDLAPERGSYVYHHFDDNCSTRLRDYIDRYSAGKLRSDSPLSHAKTLRAVVRQGLAGHPALLVVSELVLGRRVDSAPTSWEAMFLPSVLRERVHRRLGAPPRVMAVRSAPLPSGDPNLGWFVIAWAGALMGIACGVVHAIPRRGVRPVGLVLGGLAFGGVGLLLCLVACVSPLPDLTETEVLLVVTPLDLLLLFLRGRWLTWFIRLRIGGLVAVAMGAMMGVFVQPLMAPICALAAFHGSIGFVLERSRSG